MRLTLAMPNLAISASRPSIVDAWALSASISTARWSCDASEAADAVGPSRAGLPGAGMGGSLPEVGEGQRHVGDLLFQERDRRLQVVALGTADAHGVALDARVSLQFAVLDQAHDLLRMIGRHAVANGDRLLDLVAADLLHRAVIEEAHVDVALGALGHQHVAQLPELEVVVGI